MLLNTDVLVSILDCVNPSDLPSLCRVNTTFYQLASNHLYRRICYPDVLRVCYTLLFRPDLAAKVRHFEIPHLNTASQRCWSTLSTIAKTLRSMTGLQSLYVIDVHVPSWVLQHCPFRVTTFSFAPECDADLAGFLELQEQIQDLTLGSCNPNLVLKPTALPNLAQVKAQPTWLRVLMPGRPIYNVTFRDVSHGVEVDIEFLRLSTAPIQRLSITAEHLCTLSIPRLAALVPKLAILVITYPFVDRLDTWVSPLAFSPTAFTNMSNSSKKAGPSPSGWF